MSRKPAPPLPSNKMPDWSSSVRYAVKKDHPVVFHAFCQDCGIEVKACWRCQKRKEYLNGACHTCWNSFACSQPDDPLDPSVAPMFICSRCDLQRKMMGMYEGYEPPKDDKDMEVYKFTYEPACRCCPMSPDNVCKIPRMVSFSWGKPSPLYKQQYDARRAFKQEMEFSGNAAEALILYAAFFRNRPPGEDNMTGKKLLEIVEKQKCKL